MVQGEAATGLHLDTAEAELYQKAATECQREVAAGLLLEEATIFLKMVLVATDVNLQLRRIGPDWLLLGVAGKNLASLAAALITRQILTMYDE